MGVQGIVQAAGAGTGVNVNKGSFGTPGASGISAVWVPLVDAQLLLDAQSTFTYFDGVRGPNLTNMPRGGLVPGGERWDLYGFKPTMWNATGVRNEALRSAWNTFVLSAYYVITLGTIEIRNVPLTDAFGSVGMIDSFVTPTLAAAGPGVEQSYTEAWPDTLFLTLSSTVQMQFKVNTVTATTGVSTFYLGFSFKRARAAQTP